MKKMASGQSEVLLLLHDIRSIHNVGSIFRTADAFGVTRIFLSGYTPAPIDRFGRRRADLAKVALGAEKSMAWEKLEESPVEFIEKFDGKIVAIEQDSRSVDYRDVRAKVYRKNSDSSKKSTPSAVKILLILGNEVGGINRDILDLADIIAEIPMRGTKESLNVSVAAGIALFGIFG
jgi:tRNA G18 (ribose-2'-O)-methylase SpoU